MKKDEGFGKDESKGDDIDKLEVSTHSLLQKELIFESI